MMVGGTFERLPPVEAVVVALGDDFAIFEIEEDGEMGAHGVTGGEGTEGYGKSTGPNDFERDVITISDGADNLVALGGNHFFAAHSGLEEVVEVAARAVRSELIGEFFLDDAGGKKICKRIPFSTVLECLKITAGEGEMGV